MPVGRSARDVAADVERAVRSGELAPGDLLPPVRQLASALGLSPTTVAAAYRTLRARGIAVGDGRRGTRIRRAPPVARRIGLRVPAGVRDLSSGGPDPSLLPDVPLEMRIRRGYGETATSPALAAAARTRFDMDGIDATHLAVVSGALDGVERVLAAWLRPGDRVAVEDPCYLAARDLLDAMGLEAEGVAMDRRGVLPEALAAAAGRGCAAFLCTPRAQNPTGSAWDPERRDRIHTVLRSWPEVLVVEDDHAGEIAGVPAQTASEGRTRWAVIRSVSKSLGPDLRVAVMAGDETTVARVVGHQAVGAGWVSWMLQDAVAQRWADPAVRRVLERAAATYARRRQGMGAALDAVGMASTAVSGLCTWVPVGDESSVVSALLADGWAVVPGSRFRLGAPPGVRVAFSTLEPDDAARFAQALARAQDREALRSD